ncbi:CTP:molybdopterin cytidylyltransferase [Pseudonocardia sp. Ae168_Ps1]|uniref:nucleotidyltransferase family protein n=1 Tax=unclassified Pseudonocardia TaxID=2619320 RepID=UPI00094AB78E|nr:MULTISPECIES: nucleotidyltransferase family protein [unclassified Pseudonocardia]OLL74562.1 CTP:molybdopterin cytidylyltransferase [Pseudonocardia sp. Ae150A_Ps1]OLL80542.1 CTP:molybdopterin cytidylyltransferase [Pseudonocardia sp. Ae168_Ps1]OLL85328.1 CTP:molybdopterin cytidylyltransferase [Pseudonocardia sp. Ae263_Ps1]OLL94644.1 CTP:molybdopterin cytidylyltransferase [Pseudonocardia sp. Ae356_Ps1]
MVAGLLLAGGAGRRMGTPKALVRLHGEPLAVRAVKALQAGGCGPVTVVLGARSDDVTDVLRSAGLGTSGSDVGVVVAEDWDEGMGASLRRGLDALTHLPGTGAALVHLVDLPGVGPEAIARVSAGATHSSLRRAAYDGVPGHPVLLGRDHWSGVVGSAAGDAGARDYLSGSTDLELVECGDVAEPDDVDTPAQLRKLAGST